MHKLFLYQWNNNFNSSRILQDWWDIGFLEEDYSSEWSSPSFAVHKKNGKIRVVTDFRKFNLLLKREMSPISYSKYWGHDPFNGRLYLFYSYSIRIKSGLFSHQNRC
jgi:hypothetical protein